MGVLVVHQMEEMGLTVLRPPDILVPLVIKAEAEVVVADTQDVILMETGQVVVGLVAKAAMALPM